MIHAVKANSYDVAIIGGGVLGLWAARHAIKRGEKVILLEKRHIGAGASGGFLGALMPHMPDNWNTKKQFQFDGLSSLPNAVAELEADTGIDCEYRRCGRLMPIPHEKLFKQIDRRIEGAKQNWNGRFSLSVEKSMPQLVNAGLTEFGLQQDDLAARINPRKYMNALEDYVRSRCNLIEGQDVTRIFPDRSELHLASGDKVFAERVVVANGYEAYPLLQPFMGSMNGEKPIGRGVKGQAVLVEYCHDDTMPIIYHDGSYIVPHKNNLVAIGSTSVNDWTGQKQDWFDENDMSFYERAIALVPDLKDAPIIDCWSAVRPRNTIDGRGTEPYFGSVPGHENLIAMIGGFKITLGIAHIATIQPL